MQSLKAEVRTDLRKSMSRQLRNEGKVPAVMYGKTVEETPVYVDKAELTKLIRQKGRNAIVSLQLRGHDQPAMIGEIQRDPIKHSILHVDFQEVNMREELTTEVDLYFLGEEDVSKKGAVLQKQLHKLQITCLPNALPSAIEVDVSALDVGDTITVSDLALGAGVSTALEEDAVIATVVPPALEKDEDEPQIDEGAEPELVDAEDGPGMDAAK
jgi:large subunit ribosomal protein L25